MEFILIVLGFLVFIFIASQLIETPKDIGDRGEGLVMHDLLRLDRTQYKVINDINIPNPKAQLGLAYIIRP